MKAEIKIPAMGESISEATIGTILKPSGSKVKTDDELLELETDKVNQVLYAPQNGVVFYTVKPEEVVKIGQVIGYVDSEAIASTQDEPKKEPSIVEPKIPEGWKPEPPSEGGARVSQADFIQEIKAPKEPKKMETKTGPLKETGPGERTETRRKMSRIRKVIAARLVEVQKSTAMLTTFNEADLTQIIQLRERSKDSFLKEHGVKLGFMSFFVKATVSALKEFPDFNSYIDGEDIVHREYYDIGIAVGTDKGLVVPVVRECNRLSFADIEKSIENYAKRAREGGLRADELQGGGFTITNGGIYGSMLSTPILNPPQSGILGMHKIQKRPVVVDDEIVIRQMMYLALSYDHRIVDGKEAVSFLVHIKNCLEDPARMLLE